MQTAKGDSAMLKSHVTDKAAVGEEGNVHGRKGKQRMHDIGSRGSNAEETTETND